MRIIHLKIDNGKILKYLLYLFPIAAILAITLIVNKNYTTILHPDFSGNIVLGKVIANENRLIFSKNWYYGQEIRFIHSQIIYSLLFRLTSDFKIVTVASTAISLIILISCFYFFLKCIGESKYFPFLSLLILIPWPIGVPSDYPYHIIILIQQDYIPYLCFSFLILGGFIYFLKNKTHFYLFLTCVTVLTLLYSISGTRAIVSLIAPMLLVYILIFFKDLIKNKKRCIINRKKEIFFICSIGIASLVGLVINKFVLINFFNFNPNGFNVNFSFNSIKNALVSLFRSLSVPTSLDSKSLMVFQLLIFIGIFIEILFACVSYIKKELSFEQKFVFEFVLIGIFLTFISYCLMNFYNSDNGFRYYFLLDIFLVCFVFLPLKYFKNLILNIKFKPLIISLTGFAGVLFILSAYHFTYNISRYNDLTNVVNTIKSKDFKISYSFWEDANQIYQLSNSEIDSYTFNSYKSGFLNPSTWICEKKKTYINLKNIAIVINKTHKETNLFKKCEFLANEVKDVESYNIFFVLDAHLFFENSI